MKSMTGYGEASQNIHGTRVTVQIRTLNHRHLDLQLRVPREYLALEEEIRKTIRQKIARGRIDLFINRYTVKAPARELAVDEHLLGQYVKSLQQVKKKFHLAGEMDMALLSGVPELFRVREAEIDNTGEHAAVLKALSSSLKKLEQSREREGGHLRKDMESHILHLRKVANGLTEKSAENGIRVQKAPVRDGIGIRSDETNSIVLKGDVNEELVRLKTHLASLIKIVREREPVGKKIDFMLQEVNRELNTISSKVPYLPVVQLVLEGKERVEKIREQTQNIE